MQSRNGAPLPDLFGETPPPAPGAPLELRQPPPRGMRFSRRLVWVVLALGIGIGGTVLLRSSQPPRPKAPPVATPTLAPPPLASVTMLPKDYDRIPPDVPPPAAPPPEPPRGTIPVAALPPAPQTAPRVAAPGPKPTSAQAQTKPKPERWLFATGEQKHGAPFPAPKELEMRAARTTKAEQLIRPADWATPTQVERVLYRDIVIPGLLFEGINSDTPGQVKVMLTQHVLDRQQRAVLLPQFTNAMMMPKGNVTYGQQRLEVVLEQFIFPDGTVLGVSKGQVGDADGTGGLKAEVDNHYVQLGIAAVLSAALSLGPRIAAGSQTGYAPNLGQEFANQAATSFNQTGQQIIQRELLRKPTLTRASGTPVTIQLLENLSLQSNPTVVTK